MSLGLSKLLPGQAGPERVRVLELGSAQALAWARAQEPGQVRVQEPGQVRVLGLGPERALERVPEPRRPISVLPEQKPLRIPNTFS